jgi:4-amino-4-deoxy-L-arabinose transferase-like glycosyltransferase
VTGLWALALTALAARLLTIAWIPAQPVDDFWSYLARARNLAETGLYGPLPGYPDAAYPPAYPLLLTVAHALRIDALVAAKLLNALLGTASVVLTALLGRKLAGDAVGWVAGGLAVLHPRSLLAAVILASENLFAPLLLGLLLVLVTAVRRSRAIPLAGLAGGIVGLLALTRAVGYPLGVLWPLVMLAGGRRWRPVVAETMLLLAIQHAVMLPWALRNAATLDRFTFLTSTGGINLYIGNSEGAQGGWYPWRPSLARAVPDLERRSVFGMDDAAATAARDWIRREPRRALRLYARKLGLILLPDESYVVFYSLTGRGFAPPVAERPVLVAAHPLGSAAATVVRGLTVWHWAVVVLGGGGAAWLLAMAIGRRDRAQAAAIGALVAAASYFPLVAAVFLASTRFRWPMDDLLLVVSPVLVVSLAYAARRSGRRAGEGTTS